MKKKLILGFALSFFIGGLTVNAAPVNSNFDDDDFYACVVRNYNEAKGTNYSVSYNLTDTQLSSMTKLICIEKDSPKQYSSLKGLEKLIGITQLTLNYTGLTGNIDLSKNSNLEKIWFYGNSIESLDLSHNTSLASIVFFNDSPEVGVIHINDDSDKELYMRAIIAGSEERASENSGHLGYNAYKVTADGSDSLIFDSNYYASDFDTKFAAFINNLNSNNYQYINFSCIKTPTESLNYKIYFDGDLSNNGSGTTDNGSSNQGSGTTDNGSSNQGVRNELAQAIMKCYGEGNCPKEYDLDGDGEIDSADASYALVHNITSLPSNQDSSENSGKQNTSDGDSNKQNTSVDNPKTGVYGCIGILGISAIAGVYYFVNRKNKIVKI